MLSAKIRRVMHDLFRIIILMVVVGYWLHIVDATNDVVFQVFGIGAFLTGGTHLIRRIMFPSLDLQKIAYESVQHNNVAAAIVFSAIILFLIMVMAIPLALLR